MQKEYICFTRSAHFQIINIAGNKSKFGSHALNSSYHSTFSITNEHIITIQTNSAKYPMQTMVVEFANVAEASGVPEFAEFPEKVAGRKQDKALATGCVSWILYKKKRHAGFPPCPSEKLRTHSQPKKHGYKDFCCFCCTFVC